MGTTWSCDCFEELGYMSYDDAPRYNEIPYDVETPLLASVESSPENSPPGRTMPPVHYHPPFTGTPKMEEWDIL